MISTIRQGSTGSLVQVWQDFLRGKDFYRGETTGEFDTELVRSTKLFQSAHGLTSDGIVGNSTWGAAMTAGLEMVRDDSTEIDVRSPNYPAPPDFPPADTRSRQEMFGQFNFVPDPKPSNPEGIKILGDWVEANITAAVVPQLIGVPGAPPDGKVFWHRAGEQQLLGLFSAWEEAGLLDRIISWGGSWAPRFVRGSKTYLSNHAYGSAFDINPAQNGLGCRPALVDERGCVRELVYLANAHGFWWGGHGWNGTRKDGMHFEIARLGV